MIDKMRDKNKQENIYNKWLKIYESVLLSLKCT